MVDTFARGLFVVRNLPYDHPDAFFLTHAAKMFTISSYALRFAGDKRALVLASTKEGLLTMQSPHANMRRESAPTHELGESDR